MKRNNLFVSRECGGCEVIKKKLDEEIRKGDVRILDVETKEAMDEMYRIKDKGLFFLTIPVLAVEDEKGNIEIYKEEEDIVSQGKNDKGW